VLKPQDVSLLEPGLNNS